MFYGRIEAFELLSTSLMFSTACRDRASCLWGKFVPLGMIICY